MKFRPRVLVLAHGHPDFSLGGGEIAAYSLFQGYAHHPAVAEAFFLARIDRGRPAKGNISLYADREYLWEQQLKDGFFISGNIHATLTSFTEFIVAIKPDIVHIHHVIHIGYEIIEVLKRINPNIKIYFTLHEYIHICHNSGQMIKTNGNLCYKESLDACARCFSTSTAADFWQRKKHIQHYFSLINAFIAPSEFLRQRYIAWGIAPERIHVLENGMRSLPVIPPRPIHDKRGRNRFAFFGQVNPYKGLSLILHALSIIPKKQRKHIIFEAHAANLELQSQTFQREVNDYAAPLIKEGVLRWIGPYEPSQISSRMAGVDWVVVPSIWWENSPVVIQEAFSFGRPVLASDIGGMAEKVRNNIDGILVQARNPQSWADVLMETCSNEQLWEKLHRGIKKTLSVEESTDAHLKLFGVLND